MKDLDQETSNLFDRIMDGKMTAQEMRSFSLYMRDVRNVSFMKGILLGIAIMIPAVITLMVVS